MNEEELREYKRLYAIEFRLKMKNYKKQLSYEDRFINCKRELNKLLSDYEKKINKNVD